MATQKSKKQDETPDILEVQDTSILGVMVRGIDKYIGETNKKILIIDAFILFTFLLTGL